MAVLKLDLKSARNHLESRCRLLGKAAADRLIDRAEGAVDGADPGIETIVEEVVSARAAAAALEKRIAEAGESGDRPAAQP